MEGEFRNRWPHPTDTEGICNVEAPVRGYRNSMGAIECGRGCRATIPPIASNTVPGHRRDDAVQPHPADTVISFIRNVEAAISSQSNRTWLLELRLGGWATIPSVAVAPLPSYRRHKAVRPNSTDAAIIFHLRDVQATISPDRNPRRGSELACCGRAAVTFTAISAVAGDCRNDPIRTHAADTVIIGVGNEEAPIWTYSNSHGTRESCLDGWAAITAITVGSGASHGGNAATGTYVADAIIVVVSNIEIVVQPYSHSAGLSELCLGGRAAIA
jgi:hypothetical protein